MNFKNFTLKTQEAIQKAQELAQSYAHPQIEVDHLLFAILEIDHDVVTFLFQKNNLNIDLIKQIVASQLKKMPTATGSEIMLSRNLSTVLNDASILSKKMNDEFVSIEHVLIAILKDKSLINK